MKKTTLLFACAAAVFAFAGCQKENVGNDVKSNKIKVTFTAETGKSVLNGKDVSWADKDRIDVYDGTSRHEFLFSEGAIFKGELSAGATNFYAIYPQIKVDANTDKPSKFFKYTSAEGKDSVVCRTWLQTCQNTVKDGFAPYANLSACTPTLEGDKLSGGMINLCSYFKFTLTSSKINRVIFKSSYNRKISGQVDVSFYEGAISVEGKEVPYVECKPTGKQDTIEPGTYYVCVLPGSYGYIEISMADTDGNIYELKTKSTVKCARNEVANFGTLDADLASRKTDKLSLFYNFTTATNMSGYATSSKQTTDVTLTLGDKKYVSKQYYIYYRSTYGTFGTGAYLYTPAIEGYALDQVIFTTKSHNNNGASTIKLYDLNDDQIEYSGAYKFVTGPNFGINVDSNAATYYTAYNNNANYLYNTHILTFGKNGPAELASQKMPESAKKGAADNTSYKFYNSSSGSCNIIAIELTYKKYVEPEPESVVE